ncbi:MAG: prepilin-type N-terminal cleavage/methylation domain-containing protein [Candidatus Paceibacterota bacterium]
MFKNFHKNKYNSGVTLIELLVVIFIFMILTGITIFNYGKFNSSLSIQNLADDIALTVRRAQGFAIGVRGFGSSFSQGYGIHFTANQGLDFAGSNKAFVLFADMNPNYKYDHDSSNTCGKDITTGNECIEVLSIVSADEISAIFLNDSQTSLLPAGTIDILFKRPNPEPIFCVRSNPLSDSCDSGTISSVRIKISNITNPETFKIITISNNGQINVSN